MERINPDFGFLKYHSWREFLRMKLYFAFVKTFHRSLSIRYLQQENSPTLYLLKSVKMHRRDKNHTINIYYQNHIVPGRIAIEGHRQHSQNFPLCLTVVFR